MKHLQLFEDFDNIENTIIKIKKHLIEPTLMEDEIEFMHNDLDTAWQVFVDNQELGECQSIVADISRNFPMCKKVFGEIEIDNPYYDEYGEEQNFMTHHWITIDGKIYDFSKGTLKDYIDFDDLYDVSVDDEYRYN